MVNRVRAIIIKGGEILVFKRTIGDLVFYVFPGGCVEKNESLDEALKRECKEELGIQVEILKKFCSERFDRKKIKQLEHFYICKIVSGQLGTGNGPEFDENFGYEGAHELEWLNINELESYDLRPENVKMKLLKSYAD